jgi:anti-anti-sigma factor
VSEVPLYMRARIANGIANVAISGELDLSNAAKLDAVLGEVERVEDVELIWLDMRGLEFIDSTGAAVLCDAIDRARGNSDRLRLTGTPSPAVRRLLELTGIAERLPTEWRDGRATRVRARPAH